MSVARQGIPLVARNGASLIVSRITRADLAALQQFNAELSEATRQLFLPHAYDVATLARIVERDELGLDRIYLLRAGPEVAGYFFLWEFDHPAPLLGIGLADAWQGQGLGRPMLALLINDARAAGREAVELTTVLTNDRALRLYQRAGFQDVGVVENRAGDGRILRERRMFLALRPGATPAPRDFKPPV
ncbi:MAG: hypothetical protein RIQ93_2001 [Verrucomicrobiota bacterium]|jgi:ribosomal-protein-alanine N-acetyltransferase